MLAVAEGAIDRSVGIAGGRAALLAESSAIGSLWLDRTDVADVLAATWAGAPAQATIGPLLPPLDGRGKQVHVGSLAPPDRTMAWRVLLMAAHASAVMKIAGAAGGSSSPGLLLGDAVGAHPEDHGFGETDLGVQMVGKVCPVGLSAIGALGCVLVGRWDLLGPMLRPAGVAAELARYLLIDGRLDDAGRVLACARTTRGDELLACEAILAALGGDPDAAIAAVAGACSRSIPPTPMRRPGWPRLLAGRRDFDDALVHARRAVEVGNGWPETVTLCRVLWLADRADEARATLDRLRRRHPRQPGHPGRATARRGRHPRRPSARPCSSPRWLRLPCVSPVAPTGAMKPSDSGSAPSPSILTRSARSSATGQFDGPTS